MDDDSIQNKTSSFIYIFFQKSGRSAVISLNKEYETLYRRTRPKTTGLPHAHSSPAKIALVQYEIMLK
jgi:hypothetical protein